MKIKKLKNKKRVLIVHAIDTEGPLYESLSAKFERLNELYKIDHIPATHENFKKLQRAEIDLDGIEVDIQRTLSGHLINYNDTWDKIDLMLDEVMSKEFRTKFTDSLGAGWVFNWHCMDHVSFDYNPRRRDMGYNNIFDHYKERLQAEEDCPDGLHWHFHPLSCYREAHRCATSYLTNDSIYQILCRKIIDRDWFPSVFRAGFQTERPDSNWFLEQWIPFDISNMALDDNSELDSTVDFRNGRSGDWRLAPSDWSIYNPSHDNYQIKGNCRRWIGRALNVLNRVASIDQHEMDKAFSRADTFNEPVIVGLASHDFRNLATEVDYICKLIKNSQQRYPEVEFVFSEAIEAFRTAIWPDGIEDDALDFELKFNSQTERDVPNIEIITKKGKVFGPQPFLAIKTKSQRYIHDNFDFSTSGDRWFYAFHGDTLPLEDVAKIAVAASDKYGNVCIKHIDFSSL